MVRTFADQPGMIYYEIIDKENPDEAYECDPYTVENEEGNTVTVYARDVNTGLVLVSIGSAILIGTIIEDVFTGGLGIADDTVTIAAANALIRKGIQYVPGF